MEWAEGEVEGSEELGGGGGELWAPMGLCMCSL